MDNRQFMVILIMMFLFPFIAACENKKNENHEMPSLNASNSEEVFVKDDFKEENDIGEAISCTKEEYTINYTKHFSPEVSFDEIPESMDIVYYNSSLQRDMVVPGILMEKGVDDTSSWRETIECEMIFTSEEEDNFLWNIENGECIYLSLNSDKPVWDGYENDVLETFGYLNQGYVAESAEWDESYISKDRYEKKAVYTFIKNKKGYYGTYEGVAYDLLVDQEESLKKVKKDSELLEKYRERNSDVYGIIRIDDTTLNHPIMKNLDDEDFYLWHDLDKNYNSHGVPFLGREADLEKTRGNTVIYGHRVEDGDVFGNLYRYEDIEYYKSHPVIETVSENGNQRWLILSCYLLCTSDEDSFDYADENAFMSLERYEEYIENVQKRSFYSVNKQCGINDAYLTLSSCSKEKTGEGTNRIAILAVRIPYDSDVSEIVSSATENPTPYLPEKMRDKD